MTRKENTSSAFVFFCPLWEPFLKLMSKCWLILTECTSSLGRRIAMHYYKKIPPSPLLAASFTHLCFSYSAGYIQYIHYHVKYVLLETASRMQRFFLFFFVTYHNTTKHRTVNVPCEKFRSTPNDPN